MQVVVGKHTHKATIAEQTSGLRTQVLAFSNLSPVHLVSLNKKALLMTSPHLGKICQYACAGGVWLLVILS